MTACCVASIARTTTTRHPSSNGCDTSATYVPPAVSIRGSSVRSTRCPSRDIAEAATARRTRAVTDRGEARVGPSPPRSRRTWPCRASSSTSGASSMPPPRCLDLIRLAAPLLERDAAQMRLGDVGARDEQAVAGKQRDVGVADGFRRDARLVGVGDGAVVLVDELDLAAAEPGRLIEARRDAPGVGPQRREAGMVVHGDVRRRRGACATRGAT